MNTIANRTIVVPIDFSDESMAAIDSALDIADETSTVYVVHVLPELTMTEPGAMWQTVDDENRIRHAKKAMKERLSDAKYDKIQMETEVGDPGHRIVDVAERVGADLIVMPSHGRTGIKRVLIGSVAERVVRLAHCPVLVLRK
jgi:nucleotide-binding universal stress UspA family protein